MIHFHGTPVTPREKLYALAGHHFCVSFADARDADICVAIGQSVLWDNGSFSGFTRNHAIDEKAIYRWLDPRLHHPHRAIVIDEIGGDVETQRTLLARWPFPRELSWPVWHLDQPLDYLAELSDHWPGLCLGSAGPFWKINSIWWEQRMDDVFNMLAKRHTRLPWIHGLRMLNQGGQRWPLASADSSNVAQSHAGNNTRETPAKDIAKMARAIDARQTPLVWQPRPEQGALL